MTTDRPETLTVTYVFTDACGQVVTGSVEASDMDSAVPLVPGWAEAKAAGRVGYVGAAPFRRFPLYRFAVSFIDRWMEPMTSHVWAESFEDAQRAAAYEKRNGDKDLEIFPVWECVRFEDGTSMLRAEWDRRQEQQHAALIAAE